VDEIFIFCICGHDVELLLCSLSAKALDEYASIKTRSFKAAEEEEIDPRLEAIVERMLEKYDNIPLFNDMSVCQMGYT
jgi:hypothetical protein